MSFVAMVSVLLRPSIRFSKMINLLGVSITPGEIARFSTRCVSFITRRMLEMVMSLCVFHKFVKDVLGL